MQSQFDLLGAFVPTIAGWFVLSLAVFVPVDAFGAAFTGCSGTHPSPASRFSFACFAAADWS